MSWLSYLWPQTLYKASTRYNRDIRVIQESGKNKLLVSGSRQSGSYIKRLWQRAFRDLHLKRELTIKSILMLGVGGGTAIRILGELYPAAQILGVDIDRVILRISRDYFRLGEIKNLQTMLADAQAYVATAVKKNQHYDLVIVDLFSGREIPDFVASAEFLLQLKQLISPGGRIIINYLRELEYQEKANELAVRLNNFFPKVQSTEFFNNRFFLVQ